MNLILLAPHEVARDGTARLTGRRAAHLRHVLRVQVGACVRVGVARGGRGTGTVRHVAKDEVLLATHLDPTPPVRPSIDLVLAIPRPKVLSRVLQTVASMGVGSVTLVNAWRVDKSYFDSKRLGNARLNEDLWVGCEQGATTWIPEIRVVRLLGDLFAELARPEAGRGALRVVAHPYGSEPLTQVVPVGVQERLVAAIGPEGGWVQRELDSFAELGFRRASLGSALLRVEVAVPVALAQLDLLRRLDGSVDTD